MGLVLSSLQTNDAKLLYLTDASTWGSDGIPAFATLKADLQSAILQISYKTPDEPDGTDVVDVDISAIWSAATSENDLIYIIKFPIPASIDGSEVGDEELPDGIWSINYVLTDSSDTYQFPSNLELLLDNVIKVKVYNNTASIPTKYFSSNNYYTKEIDDALLIDGLYYSMNANAYVAQQTQILNVLDILQRQLD